MQNSELEDEVGRARTKSYFSKYKDYFCIAIAGLSIGIGAYAGLMSIPRTEAQPMVEPKQPESHRLLTNPAEWLERRKERLQKEKDKLTEEAGYVSERYEAKK